MNNHQTEASLEKWDIEFEEALMGMYGVTLTDTNIEMPHDSVYFYGNESDPVGAAREYASKYDLTMLSDSKKMNPYQLSTLPYATHFARIS